MATFSGVTLPRPAACPTHMTASGRLSEERIDVSLERIVRTKLAWEDGSLGA